MGDVPCNHPHGAWVPEIALWICGRCFCKLGSCPKRYGPNPNWSDRAGSEPPQIIVWQAENRRATGGLTLADFLRTMAKRFQIRGGLDRAKSYNLAIEVLRQLGDQFGDEAYDWSHAGAREMADDEMSYWDHDEGERGNG